MTSIANLKYINYVYDAFSYYSETIKTHEMDEGENYDGTLL